MKDIYALGVGHGTPLFIELAEACGYRIAGLFHYNDTRTGQFDHGFPILGSFDNLLSRDLSGFCFVLTMGDMRIKQDISNKIIARGGILPTLMHPTSIVSKYSSISDCGVLIGSHCEVHSDSSINAGCVLWPCSIVEHDCQLDEYVFVGPKAYVGAYTKIGSRAFIGQCSILVSGKAQSIGYGAIVGAGALVTKPVLDQTTVAGFPAKHLEK